MYKYVRGTQQVAGRLGGGLTSDTGPQNIDFLFIFSKFPEMLFVAYGLRQFYNQKKTGK